MTTAGTAQSAGGSARRRLYLLMAAVWLQLMVMIFVVIETKRRIHTPLSAWLNKIAYLLGL
jgi:hypothetical protein